MIFNTDAAKDRASSAFNTSGAEGRTSDTAWDYRIQKNQMMKQYDSFQVETVRTPEHVETAAATQPAKRRGPAPPAIGEMQVIATRHGGRCLST
jgi:hypothetical protein